MDLALEAVRQAGFQVANLFQLHAHRWRCNLRSAGEHYEFADADTAEDAVLLALTRMPSVKKTSDYDFDDCV